MAHIYNSGYAVVNTDPNTITELQSVSNIKLVILEDGTNVWKYVPANTAGQKWVKIDNDIAITKIDEGNGPGLILNGRDGSLFGPIGSGSLDLSESSGASTTRGAVGSNCFTMGYDVVAGGYAGMTLGAFSSNSGNYSLLVGSSSTSTQNGTLNFGSFNTITGGASSIIGQNGNNPIAFSHLIGTGLISNSIGGVAVGQANEDSTDTGANAIDGIMFDVGNGEVNFGNGSATSRSSALKVFKSGKVTAPSYSLADITDPKDLTTKEYVDNSSFSGSYNDLTDIPTPPTTFNNIVETGTSSGGNLNIELGDFDADNNETYIRINDSNSGIDLSSGGVTRIGDFLSNNSGVKIEIDNDNTRIDLFTDGGEVHSEGDLYVDGGGLEVSDYFRIRDIFQMLGSGSSSGFNLVIPSPTLTNTRTINMPDASGTFALTSNLPTDYVDLSSVQLIEGFKTFEDDATFNNSIHGNITTSSLVVDPLGSNTGIAGSISTIKQISTSTGTNVIQFIDVNRNNTSAATGDTYGSVIRTVNNSTVANSGGAVGANLVGRHSGSGNLGFAYGSITTAEYTGSGNVDFLVPDSQRATISGTGSGTIDYIRGNSPQVKVENPNATVNFAQGSHPSVSLISGNINDSQVLFLDYDITTANLGTTLNLNGDLSFIRGGSGSDVTTTKADLESNGHKGRFIWNESTWESDFNGIINVLNPITDIDAATNKVLVTKEWVNAQSFGGSVDLSNYVTLNGSETITGSKTFSSLTSFTNDIWTEGDLVFRGSGPSGFATINNPNISTSEVYNLPSTGGTFALLSDIPSNSGPWITSNAGLATENIRYEDTVRIGPNSDVGSEGEFNLAGSAVFYAQTENMGMITPIFEGLEFRVSDGVSLSDTPVITLIDSALSGSVGVGVAIPTEKLDVSGNVKANSFIKQGGLSSEFLKADGSSDNTTYDNYSSWNLRTSGIQRTTVQSGGVLDFNSNNSAIDIAYSAGGVVNFTLQADEIDYTDLQNLPTIPTNNNQLTNGANYQVEGEFQLVSNATTSITLSSSDKGTVITPNSSSAVTVNITETSLTTIGDIAYVDQVGTGEVTFVAGGTATFQINSSRQAVTDGQYSRVAIHKTSATAYRIFGELKTI